MVLPTLVPAPKEAAIPAETRICIGIDIGKARHVAGVVSPALLSEKHQYHQCPTLAFENSREGFTALLAFLRTYGPPESLAVVVEVTGHYHRLLVDFLTAHGIPCYLLATSRRIGELKTDKRDAQQLAYQLYQFLYHRQQPGDREIRPDIPLSEEMATLARLVRHRYELSHELTRYKNKLIALCDELFPEFTAVCVDPNSKSALALREHFPTCAAVAQATLDELKAARYWRLPGAAALKKLQALAQTSIGCTDPGRLAGLCLEQQQLITRFRLLATHLEHLEAEITRLVEGSREGQIVRSIDGIGTMHAASILATIGTITRFDSAAKLRKYCGWSPTKEQSGKLLDKEKRTPSGKRLMRQALYLAAMHAIQQETAWRKLYLRLVPRMCEYDQKKGEYRGKNRVLARICGQMITIIYHLLAQDAALLAQLPEGAPLPPPLLYNPGLHQEAMH